MAVELVITSAQEAAFNACGEAMADLGIDFNLKLTCNFIGYPHHFSVTAKVPHLETKHYVSKGGPTAALALLAWVKAANELLANPPPKVLREPQEVKDAVAAIVDQYRAGGGEQHLIADEIADRIAALPVTE